VERVSHSGLASRPPCRPGMDRRRFLLTSAAGTLAMPLAAAAQEPGKMARIGYLSYGTATGMPGYARRSSTGYEITAGSMERTSRSSTDGRVRTNSRWMCLQPNWPGCHWTFYLQ
jgi:hypothetical protein